MSKMIQLRNVPDALHRQLKARAALAGMALSDYLIRIARKSTEVPTEEEVLARLASRTPYTGTISPTDIIRQERDSR
jgi:plasmid stability protein